MVVWGWFGERPSLAFFFKIGPASFFFFHIPPRTPHTRPRGPAGEWGNVGCFNFTLLYAHDIPPKTQKYQKHTICLRKRKKSGGGMYSPTERFPPPLSPRWGNAFLHRFPQMGECISQWFPPLLEAWGGKYPHTLPEWVCSKAWNRCYLCH